MQLPQFLPTDADIDYMSYIVLIALVLFGCKVQPRSTLATVGNVPEVVLYERVLQGDRKVEPLATEPGFSGTYVDLMLMQSDGQGGLPLLTPLGFSALRLDTVQREVRVFRQGEPIKILQHMKLGTDADTAIRQNLGKWRQDFEATFKGPRAGCASGSFCADLARALLNNVMQVQAADGTSAKQLPLQ